MSKKSPEKQQITLHNYVYEDYLAKYGRICGLILARLQLSAIKRAANVVACSESLSEIYREKLGLSYGYIRNGIDLTGFSRATESDRYTCREKLGIPGNAFVFIYTGQFIERKNVHFLLENYIEEFGNRTEAYLLLLGDGPERQKLQNYK